MSFPLPSVDLTSAVAGTTGTISLNNVGVSAGGVSNNPRLIKSPAMLALLNESGCGLQIVYSQGGQGFNLPAGAWTAVALPPGENLLTYTVLYSLTNPQVSKLLLTYYAPGEQVPQSMTLGNSPIGGSTATAGNVLSNEAATLGSKIIDIGIVGNTDMLDIFNDHFLWKVIQSSVAHQVLAGNNAGNPLQLGQAGDITEVLGKLLIDQVPSATATPPTGTGSITVYEMTFGQLKIAVVLQTNFKNTSASQFTLALPTAFTAWAYVIAGQTTQTELLSGGVAQGINIVTSLAAGGASPNSLQTVIFQYNIGATQLPFDTLRFQASNGTTHTSDAFILIGV